MSDASKITINNNGVGEIGRNTIRDTIINSLNENYKKPRVQCTGKVNYEFHNIFISKFIVSKPQK
jgi:hypothetical protein